MGHVWLGSGSCGGGDVHPAGAAYRVGSNGRNLPIQKVKHILYCTVSSIDARLSGPVATLLPSIIEFPIYIAASLVAL